MPNPTKQQNISISQNNPGTYTIDPVDDIDMKGQGQGVIQWDIVTTGWNFAANDGIFFKSNGNQMQNTPGQIPGQPNRWQANDLNTTQPESLVTYGINVVGPGGATATLDPTIVNGQGHV
jgi:hypothetical protein